MKKKTVNCEFVKCVWFAWKALLLVFNRLKCSSYLHPALQHTHLKRTTTLQFHDVYNHVHDLIFSCTMHSNPFGYWFAWSKTGYAFQTKSEDVTVASWNNLFLHIPVLLSSKPKPSSKEACLHWWTTTTGVNVSFMGWRRGSTFFSFFLCFIIMVRPPSDDEWATFRKIIFFSALATWAWVCACMGGGGEQLGPLQSSRAQDGPDVTGTYMHETMTSGSTYYCTTFSLICRVLCTAW